MYQTRYPPISPKRRGKKGKEYTFHHGRNTYTGETKNTKPKLQEVKIKRKQDLELILLTWGTRKHYYSEPQICGQQDAAPKCMQPAKLSPTCIVAF